MSASIMPSPTNISTLPPGTAASNSAFVSSSTSLRRARIITVAPSRSSNSAEAEPMPPLAPVTIAVMPSRGRLVIGSPENGVAAVDDHRLAGDVPGGGAGQEQDGAG